MAKGLQAEPGSPDAFGLRRVYARPCYHPRAWAMPPLGEAPPEITPFAPS